MPVDRRPRRIAPAAGDRGRKRDRRSVFIVGAGLLGCLTALELAARGARVVLADRGPGVFAGASAAGEGKIHLGYVFARDAPDRTARLMLDGAFAFAAIVGRHVGTEAFARHLSAPFVYRVLPGSLSSPQELAAFYGKVDAMIAERLAAPGVSYLGGAARFEPVRRLADDPACGADGPALAAFATTERAVDPAFLRAAIGAAVAADERIETVFGCTVTGFARTAGGGTIPMTANGPLGRFDRVVNAAWDQRLKLDATLGHVTRRPVLHRRKVGMVVRVPADRPAVESATLVLGAFGDVVNYGGGRLYLSWYPSGCIARTDAIAPPDDWRQPLGAREEECLFEDAATRLGAIVPGLTAVLAGAEAPTLTPGVITSWGAGDVDQRETELHHRFEIGPQMLEPGYFSVDTGKLTMAPLFASRTAAMVMA
ncbi:FAD-dependent oxidoreductase [Acuticoccus sp. MNP-M23]|uniref:FAD-dependent oxidoreductase n=1 Tax=Acuticoccus sp. MNP-M23 TaxID=3072793 RepID=UPI002814B666|nr:FAD-dependent oxidoreductase [Acuticoccus sp. MNP-M23]WMS43883.1 FAD-dependent oxidoreductase [Acuticoccus sp. MNP-M23]